MSLTLYFAAPLFTQAERIWNRQLAAALQRAIPRCEVVLPQLRAAKFLRKRKPDLHRIVDDCIEGIQRADLVVAILDGSDADSGTCWECGYAYALGKPIVGVRTDLRASEDEGVNAMLRRTCTGFVKHPATAESLTKLAAKIAAQVTQIRKHRT